MEAALTDGARQRPDHVILSQHVGRRLRPVPAIESLVLLLLRHNVPPVR